MATINDAVREMYLTQTGREADPGGLEYFVNRFGSDIDPEELAIFRQMAADEVAGQEARQAAAQQQAQQAAAEAAAATTSAGTGMSIADVYQQVLGRAPDAAGLEYFSNRFGTSVDPTELSAFSAAAQPELAARPTTNSAIRDMYRQVLGREPDASGLQYFANRFGTEVDPTELGIFQGMASQEIAANAARNTGTTAGTGDSAGIQVTVTGPDGTLYGSPDAAIRAGVTNYTMGNPATTAGTGAATPAGMSITQAYQQVLGRTPNAQEIAYWTSQFGPDVDAAELSNFSVAAQPERAAAPTTNDAIRQMYLSVLGREPDASGLQYFSDRFGTDVDASELGIFRGMSTQEINANAARNAGTTTDTTTRTGTVQPITRPTGPRQVTGTQLAPAQVTNTAITGTPFTNLYTPSNVQQNAPRLSDIQAATQSANPYQSLMALTPQRTLSPSYAAQAGQTTANTNLGGYDTSLYNQSLTGLLAPSTVAGGGGTDLVNNSGDQRGPGTNNTASNIDPVALAAARVAGLFGSSVSLGPPAPVVDAAFNLTDAGRAAANAATIAGFGVDAGDRDAGSARGGEGDGGGSARGESGATGGGYMAKGGMVTPRQVKGPNPVGPDDGYTGLDIGEYVIRKKAVQKYGANIFEQINAGKIPAKRLKSLLE